MKNTRPWPRRRAARRLLPSAFNPSERDICRLNHRDLPESREGAWAEERACEHALARIVVQDGRGRLVGYRGSVAVFARAWLTERLGLLRGWQVRLAPAPRGRVA